MKKVTGLNSTLKDLDGTELKDSFNKPVYVKQIIAQTIRRGNSTDPQGQVKFDVIRAEEVSKQIYNAKDTIDLEDADYQMIQQIVESDGLLNVMSKAAALRILNDK